MILKIPIEIKIKPRFKLLKFIFKKLFLIWEINWENLTIGQAISCGKKITNNE